MTDDDDHAGVEGAVDEGQPPAQPAWVGVATFIVRSIARLWIAVMLLVVAAFAGIAVYQFSQSTGELTQLQKAPGPRAYAVVAYRRELAREIRAYGRNWRDEEAVPTPPSRPELLEEIDLARARNAELRRTVPGTGPIAPPR